MVRNCISLFMLFILNHIHKLMTITGKKIGYIRVSTVDQNPERQLDNITLHKKFIDYATGGSMDRPQLQLLKEFVREDDILYIHSMDRLGRKVKDIRDLVDFFLAKGVQVEFVKENLRFTSQQDALSNCILNILGAVAEFEHALIRERQMEGIKIAAKQGKYNLVELAERFGEMELPLIQLVNIREELRRGRMKTHFSTTLLDQLAGALKLHEQAILFQNRRGFSLRLECEACNWMPSCKNCDVTLVYHKKSNQLRCHYCGYIASVPSLCPVCQSPGVKMKGFGTEKVEEELGIFKGCGQLWKPAVSADTVPPDIARGG